MIQSLNITSFVSLSECIPFCYKSSSWYITVLQESRVPATNSRTAWLKQLSGMALYSSVANIWREQVNYIIWAQHSRTGENYRKSFHVWFLHNVVLCLKWHKPAVGISPSDQVCLMPCQRHWAAAQLSACSLLTKSNCRWAASARSFTWCLSKFLKNSVIKKVIIPSQKNCLHAGPEASLGLRFLWQKSLAWKQASNKNSHIHSHHNANSRLHKLLIESTLPSHLPPLFSNA